MHRVRRHGTSIAQVPLQGLSVLGRFRADCISRVAGPTPVTIPARLSRRAQLDRSERQEGAVGRQTADDDGEVGLEDGEEGLVETDGFDGAEDVESDDDEGEGEDEC